MELNNIFSLITQAQIWLVILIIYLGVAWIYLKIGIFVLDYVFIPVFFIFSLRNLFYLKKNQEHRSNEKHIAVILVNNYMPERLSIYATLDIPKLIKYFKKKNWSYKIYFRVDKSKLKKIINNPDITMIYLIGHGQRHGIKVSKKEMVYYCEFQNSPKKEFIAQLHCNHYGGTSLIEYIAKNPKKSFVTQTKLNNYKLNKLIDEVLKGNRHGHP